MSEAGGSIAPVSVAHSARNLVTGMSAYKSSKESLYERLNQSLPEGKIRAEDIDKLEQQC